MTASFDLIPASASVPAPADMGDVLAFVAESLAPATRRAYRTGLADFTVWTAERGLETLPAAKGVRATMAGIRRKLGVAPKRKAPAMVDRLAAV
jgi:hypothetical protein